MKLQLLLETKYDGERVQIHFSRSKFPNHLKVFSRSGLDVTEKYGKHAVAALAAANPERDYTDACHVSTITLLKDDILILTAPHVYTQ